MCKRRNSCSQGYQLFGQLIGNEKKRHRLRACQETGAQLKMQEWDGKGSLLAFVVSKNVKRRQLSSGQRVMLGSSLMEGFAREAKERKRLLSGTRSNPGPIEQVPQMFAEPAHDDEPQPPRALPPTPPAQAPAQAGKQRVAAKMQPTAKLESKPQKPPGRTRITRRRRTRSRLLEAKERQQKAAQVTNEKRYGAGSLPQTSGEATLPDEPVKIDYDAEPYRRNPRPTTHTASAKSSSSAKDKASDKSKHDGEAAEKAAQLLGTNRDYISKTKKLEGAARRLQVPPSERHKTAPFRGGIVRR